MPTMPPGPGVEELQGGGRIDLTIVFPEGDHLLEPSNAELAARLGLTLSASKSAYSLIVIGGGPTGLSASMFAAREGVDVLVIERGGLGGQAGVTDRVDNYPGFPEGIGGAELSDRLVAHARKYGVELLEAVSVEAVRTSRATGSRWRPTAGPALHRRCGAGRHGLPLSPAGHPR